MISRNAIESILSTLREITKRPMSTGVTREQFRQAMGCFATGVTVITVAEAESEVHGMTANAFTSVSLDPLLVLVCVDHRARTHSQLREKKRFGINVLAEDQRAISEFYARSTEAHQRAEEAGACFDRTAHGTPVLRGALAYLECHLRHEQEAGDHTIFIAEVEDVVAGKGNPLLYFRGKYKAAGEDL
jgi:flavin reductase (DIM6/NTAB) family NADH-FMN oxidoreductase RutF